MPNPNVLRACLSAALLAATPHVLAFKVQNDAVHSTAEFMTGSVVKGFWASLRTGASQACHWSNKDCNPTGQQTGIIKMDVRITVRRSFIDGDSFVCGVMKPAFQFEPGVLMQAGGTAHAKLNEGDTVPYVTTFTADGSVRQDFVCKRDIGSGRFG